MASISFSPLPPTFLLPAKHQCRERPLPSTFLLPAGRKCWSSPQSLFFKPNSIPASSSFESTPQLRFSRRVDTGCVRASTAPTTGQVITCKAAVCWAPNEPLVLEDVQVDPPQAGEVRIKILFTSLCHTDLTFWQDKPNLGLFPRIFGHEAAGIVESVGEGVTDLQEGDHVLPVFTGECKECRHCRSVKSNLCEKNRIDPNRGVMLHDQKSRFSIKGKPVYFFLGSTFSEYTVVEHANVVKVNPAAPLEKICILSCGVTTGAGSVWKTAKVEKDSTVAVFGLGAIGFGVAEGARIAGASRIIGVDLNPATFEKGRIFGLTDFINPKDHDKPVEKVIQDMTDGGVDYSFECVGNAKVVESALLSCHDGWGMAVVVGVEGKSTTIQAHPNLFLYGRTLTGAFFGGVKPRSELPDVVEMYMNKELQLDEFITHELPFAEINKAFQLMIEGKSLRCVMQM